VYHKRLTQPIHWYNSLTEMKAYVPQQRVLLHRKARDLQKVVHLQASAWDKGIMH